MKSTLSVFIVAAIFACVVPSAPFATPKKPAQKTSLGKGKWVRCNVIKQTGPIYMKVGADGHFLCWTGKRPKQN
jgi:hypothetical protein